MLSAHGLALQQGERGLLAGLELAIAPGEGWLILGENGSGKSTLLAALAGWHLPVAGEVRLDGVRLPAVPRRQRARQLAWQTQQDEQAFPQSVLERVLSGRYPYRTHWQWESAADHALALQQLARLDLAGLAGRDLATLSGGERRRVAMATALVQQADCLLLDEPLSQLDLRHQQQALQVLAEEVAGGRAVVLVSHDPNHARGFATHALLLFGDGRWLAGPVADVLSTENLGALYHHPVRALQADGGRWFVPA